MENDINSNSSGWIFFVKVSFAVALLATGALIAHSMLRAMRRAAEMGREGGVTVAYASGLVGSTLSAPPCNVIDPEGEVGLKDDLEEARHTRLILP